MKATNEISEEELEEAFLDDPEFGLRLLHTDFRDQIGRYICSRLFGISRSARAEVMREVYQDTMVALMEST